MGLGVYCECGQTLPVLESQGGAVVDCPCGRRVVVPQLEEFRDRPLLLSAASVERRVERLVAAGELPPTGACASCGSAGTAEVVGVKLECERYTARASGGDRLLMLPLFLFMIWIWWREEERVEIRGRDTDVTTPVCLCARCHRRLVSPAAGIYLVVAVMIVVAGALVGLIDILAGVGVAAVGLVGLAVSRRVAYRSRQRAVKGLLRQVPVYRQVMAKYPWALVVVPPAAPSPDGLA